VIAGIVVACCLLGIGGIGFMRLLGPRLTPTPAPTQTKPVVIGATIEYHPPTGTPQPTASLQGTSRDNPYPMDSVVDIGGGMKLSVVFVTRPADEIVRQHIFVETPTPQQEYMIVAIHVVCTKKTNETCSFSTLQLKTVGSDGKVYEQQFDSSIPNAMEPGSEFFGGGSVEGSVLFLAVKDDPATVLYYEPFLFGDPIYISLQK
jgi:hypothetical protein